MADAFQLVGSYETKPQTGSPSADPSLTAPISERLSLGAKHFDTVELDDDAAVAIAFGGVTDAHVVVVKTVGGKVKVRLTSADGTTQAVPVDSFMALVCESVPVTAIDVQRVSGQDTTVKTFIGEKAS